MVNIIVGGAGGRMASAVLAAARALPDIDIVGGLNVDPGIVGRDLGVVSGTGELGIPVNGPEKLFENIPPGAVYVDLTTPSAVLANVERALTAGMNVVVGTTGIDPEMTERMKVLLREAELPSSMILTPNFSPGVHVFRELSRLAARYLPDYDVEIVELHHNRKKDAPSGTALMVAGSIAEERGGASLLFGREGEVGLRGGPDCEIGIHSVRAGGIFGEHTLMLVGEHERIELVHRLHSREALAEGCLRAVRWVAPLRDRKIHTMGDVLGI